MDVKSGAILSKLKFEDWYLLGMRLLNKICNDVKCESGKHCKTCYIGKMMDDVQMCFDLNWTDYLPKKVYRLKERYEELMKIAEEEKRKRTGQTGNLPVHMSEL